MNPRINRTVADSVEIGRALLAKTADILTASRRPIRKALETGVDAGKIAYAGAERNARQQIHALEQGIDQSARRFKALSKAGSAAEVAATQTDLLRKDGEILANETRNMIEIYLDTRAEFDKLARKLLKPVPAKSGAPKATKATKAPKSTAKK